MTMVMTATLPVSFSATTTTTTGVLCRKRTRRTTTASLQSLLSSAKNNDDDVVVIHEALRPAGQALHEYVNKKPTTTTTTDMVGDYCLLRRDSSRVTHIVSNNMERPFHLRDDGVLVDVVGKHPHDDSMAPSSSSSSLSGSLRQDLESLRSRFSSMGTAAEERDSASAASHASHRRVVHVHVDKRPHEMLRIQPSAVIMETPNNKRRSKAKKKPTIKKTFTSVNNKKAQQKKAKKPLLDEFFEAVVDAVSGSRR